LPGGTGHDHANSSQESHSPGRNLKSGLSEYYGLLPTRRRSRVTCFSGKVRGFLLGKKKHKLQAAKNKLLSKYWDKKGTTPRVDNTSKLATHTVCGPRLLIARHSYKHPTISRATEHNLFQLQK